MARLGGLGIIHRFMPIESQVEEIKKVKRSGVFMNASPVTIPENANFRQVKELKEKYLITSFLVTEAKDFIEDENDKRKSKKLREIKGILTNRDIQSIEFDDEIVKNFMTPLDKLVYFEVQEDFSTANCDLNELLSQCKSLLFKNKIEKIPILNPRK